MPEDHDLQMAARLVGLPEWDALWRIFDEVIAAHWTKVAHDFATKDTRPDYETLQWQRGYHACAQRLRREPAAALLRIERDQPKEVPE